jgi:hypothetical protein
MNNTRPDLYLASDEVRPPFEPKACFFMDRISAVGGRGDYVLVTIVPQFKDTTEKMISTKSFLQLVMQVKPYFLLENIQCTCMYVA